MPHAVTKNPADYIVPLNMNGLEGRMLRVAGPPNRQRHILLIYGHHALLERWWGLVQNLNQYGNVTMPDLPGFGGMDSFGTIGKKPDLDEFADYLAAFIKLRFKRKRITIVAISYGFVIVTRMLQRYPELTKKVDLLVSLVGFMHKDDFVYKLPERRLYLVATRFFATRPTTLLIRYGALNKPVLKLLYAQLPNSKKRMIEVGPQEFDATLEFEVKMWQANDVRTHWFTTSKFFSLDNCQRPVDLPVMHVVSQQDGYFDSNIVEQHMRVVFSGYKRFMVTHKHHTPSVLADKRAMGVMLPPALRRLLAKS